MESFIQFLNDNTNLTAGQVLSEIYSAKFEQQYPAAHAALLGAHSDESVMDAVNASKAFRAKKVQGGVDFYNTTLGVMIFIKD